MKILNAAQIREWDQYTMQHEPVTSINLMERAAAKCVEWLEENGLLEFPFVIFCGKGNNGGDGLAIARLLWQKQCHITIHILEFGFAGTDDFQVNLERLHLCQGVEIKFIQAEEHFHSFCENEIVIDALFGSGLNRPLDGLTASLVENINASGCKIISIDIPSGMPVDTSGKGGMIIRANHVLSFQCYKLAFLIPENAPYLGNVQILDIGLHPDYYNSAVAEYELTDEEMIRAIYKPRKSFAHKGSYGHALLMTGSYGKMGAAILCAKACIRSGAGLTTTHIPKAGYEIMQTAVPEAMVTVDFNSSFFTKLEADISKFSSIGIGPGIGNASETKALLHHIFDIHKKPAVLDADALNIMADDKGLLYKTPHGSIFTPHPKEFERMFGQQHNDFERMEIAKEKAKEHRSVIVLKGHHTFIATPEGKCYFNNTGNAGMAKGGSGDVLTGILTALMAQHYNATETALLGVHLHGLAGDIAAAKFSMEAMTASDIIESLGQAFASLR